MAEADLVSIREKFKHVVVLMLENASFDRVFGEKAGGRLAVQWDAPHDYSDVVQQSMAGGSTEKWKDSYLHSVQQRLRKKDGLCPGKNITMEALEEVNLSIEDSILRKLKNEFAHSDCWHAAFPGPTMPNRYFVHAATSDGHVTEEDVAFTNVKTIYNLLDENNKKWSIYFHDLPQTWLFNKLNGTTHGSMKDFEESFERDVAHGQLADYVFIEPRYLDGPSAQGYPERRANDQHPPHNFRLGDALVQKIYSTLKDSSIFTQTLFIVLYDEHGGFYDSQPLAERSFPTTIPPLSDLKNAAVGGNRVDFQRLGFRVPCLFISPWLKAGQTVRPKKGCFDHCSLISTVLKLHGISDHLTWRDRAAPTFHDCFQFEEASRELPAFESVLIDNLEFYEDVYYPTWKVLILRFINVLATAKDKAGNKTLRYSPHSYASLFYNKRFLQFMKRFLPAFQPPKTASAVMAVQPGTRPAPEVLSEAETAEIIRAAQEIANKS